jgi:uncharacterized protein YajQ (UPF0234 family)
VGECRDSRKAKSLKQAERRSPISEGDWEGNKMAQESSFDIVCKADAEEMRNAIQAAQKEIATRFDFKGSKAEIEMDKNLLVTLTADDEFKLEQLRDVFENKAIKRGLSPKMFSYGKIEAGAKMTVHQTVSLQKGIEQEDAKKIIKLIKDSKAKVQASIQGEQVRVTAKSKDDLQDVMRAIKSADFDFACQFTNYR